MSDVQITDWQQRVAVLAQAHRLQQFEIADLLVLGIEQFGATAAYDYAESVFPQYARATFQSWVTVAKHFPASIRIESDWLTFAHYQVAQGAERDTWRPDRDESKYQVAKEMVWLRQADERRLSVSALRDSISRAFELRREQFFNEHPESKPVESEPEPIIAPKPIKKDAFGADVKEFKTPWLKKQTRFHLDELAQARRVTTEQLLNRVIQDFLDAHSDEIGDAVIAAKKREAEHDAQVAAADAVEKMKREAAEQYRREHPRTLSPYEQQCLAEKQKAEVLA
jgi:hypothetical protein